MSTKERRSSFNREEKRCHSRPKPTPVAVLARYLGAGKTTLLNPILTEPHGKKFAVIVNEFGEVGIDNDFIVESDEDVFEMNNGCICRCAATLSESLKA